MRWYTMLDNSGVKLSERLNIIFIDLVSIRHSTKNKSADKLTPIEKWGLFFSYVDHDDKQVFIKSIIKSEHGIMAAQKIVKHMSKEDDNWFYQFSAWKAEMDRNTRLAIAEKKGMERGLERGMKEGLEKGMQQGIAKGIQQGIAKGMQQGIQQNAIQTAINLLKMKLGTNEQITQRTGLPLEKVLELKQQIEKTKKA